MNSKTLAYWINYLLRTGLKGMCMLAIAVSRWLMVPMAYINVSLQKIHYWLFPLLDLKPTTFFFFKYATCLIINLIENINLTLLNFWTQCFCLHVGVSDVKFLFFLEFVFLINPAYMLSLSLFITFYNHMAMDSWRRTVFRIRFQEL